MNGMTILCVDDEAVNLAVLNELLSADYQVRVCKSGEAALRILHSQPPPDLVLMDVMMPGLDGYATLQAIKQEPAFQDLPVIFVSALDRSMDEDRGFQMGAVDYITKPFVPAIVLKRIRVHLDLKQARDTLKRQNEWLEQEVARRVRENVLIHDTTLMMISQLAETRDNETAHHIARTRRYMEILCRKISQRPEYGTYLTEMRITEICKAATLHDIGKIGIPDGILLKPDQLTPEEFDVIMTHTTIGSNAIRNVIRQVEANHAINVDDRQSMNLIFLHEAEAIARSHHERWDGSGYPDGLKAEEIPLSARLMAIADVFDALTTPRVYKKMWTIEAATETIVQGRGRHFDPLAVDTFLSEQAAFSAVFHQFVEKLPLQHSFN